MTTELNIHIENETWNGLFIQGKEIEYVFNTDFPLFFEWKGEEYALTHVKRINLGKVEIVSHKKTKKLV